jgi:hypothetical protein
MGQSLASGGRAGMSSASHGCRCQQLPDFSLFAELPGAGRVFSARLLAGFGEQRDRFADASAFQKYTGIAPSPSVAATSTGSIGVGRARPSSARPSSSGLPVPSPTPSGRAPSTTATEPRARPTTPPSARSPSSGSASSFAAGSTARPTTNPATSPPSRNANHLCSNSPPPSPHNSLAVRLRARVRQLRSRAATDLPTHPRDLGRSGIGSPVATRGTAGPPGSPQRDGAHGAPERNRDRPRALCLPKCTSHKCRAQVGAGAR